MGISASAKHRLRYKALEAERHQHVCSECGAEPIVTLDGDHEPRLGCRMHPSAEVVRRTD